MRTLGVFAALILGCMLLAGLFVHTQELAVDPDVIRESVVHIGDGPQELSTEIKFYPN
ncbi:MAG: hypothetical protein NTX23_07520 [Candidatus Bipolaricaulota bacterium]|nr:hypothetical protein [Candidatus Bipolaricaulota bacterium]